MFRELQITLFCCICSTVCFAQQGWAPVGTIWHYRFYSVNCDTPFEYITYESLKDTLISSQTCRIIESKFYKSSGDTTNLGREIMYGDSVKVHIYRNNKFYRIFDFSAQPGDTITVIDTIFEGFFELNFESFNLFEYVIDSVSTYVINGDSLKQYYTSPTDSSDWSLGYTTTNIILENIGIKGPGHYACFIGVPRNFTTIGTVFGPIRCYQDQQVFYNFMNIPCDTLCVPVGITIYSEKNNLVKVYPNPFDAMIKVELSHHLKEQLEIYAIEIYNTLGQIIYKSDLRIFYLINYINLSFLPKGIYHLKIIQENRGCYNSKIVKY